MAQKTLMTVKEAAGALRVHEYTVYEMLDRGELVAIRIGRGQRRHWRIHTDDEGFPRLAETETA